MQEVLTYKTVSNQKIKELVKDQFPDMVYLFERQPKGLPLKEKSYREYLKNIVLNKLIIKV